ncbi:hypothetical protein ACHAPT_010479 [Fusarium lateritium]
MKPSTLPILLGWMAQHVAAAQIDIAKACGNVYGITHCNSQFFTYPTTPEKVLCKSPYEPTSFSSLTGIKVAWDGNAEPGSTRRGWTLARLSNEPWAAATLGIMPIETASVFRWLLISQRMVSTSLTMKVDMPLYRQLAAAMLPCQQDACDPVKLRDFFAGYIANAEGIIDSELIRMLNTWVSIFETLKKQVAAVNQASKLVQTRLATVNAKVSSTKASVCKGTACKSSTVTGHFTRISTMLSTVKGLQAVTGLSDKATKNLPNMISQTKNSISYTKNAADGAYYVDIFQNFKMSTLRDFTKAFRVTEYFPTAADKIKNSLVPFSDINKYAGQGRTGLTQIDSVLGVQWSKNKELAKTVAGRKVRDGFINIQKSVKNDLKTPVYNLVKAIDALKITLDKHPLTKKKLEWSYGAAPYNRWSEHEMKVPCAEEKTQTWWVNGFPSPPFTWTQITTCEWGPTNITYSKNFIPYIKYRFV